MGVGSVYFSVLLKMMQLIFVENKSVDSSEIREALTLISEQTEQIVQLLILSSDNMVIADNLPIGYFSRSIHNWQIAVPWPLIDEAPEEELIAEYCNFAMAARVGQESIICLSGTSARTGAISEIGDIDFAEYTFDNNDSLQKQYVTTLTNTNPSLLEIEAKIFAENPSDRINIVCPWPILKTEYTEEHLKFLQNIRTFQTKIDYIGLSYTYGYIPITNMIFPCNDRNYETSYHKSGLAYSSFSFQEVVLIGPGAGRTAWPLVDVKEYVNYIKFLVSDTLSYMEKRPIKAAKRASVLAKMLFWTEFDQEFHQILNSSYANLDAIYARIAEVRKLVVKRGNVFRDGFTSEEIAAALDDVQTKASLKSVSIELTIEKLKCREIVERFVSQLRQIVNACDVKLEYKLFEV